MSQPTKDLEAERKLVELAKIEPAAFGELFDMYYQTILGYVIRRTGDVALAEDLVSETFIKALKKLPGFTWQGTSVEAWLFTIATNEIRMHFRKKRFILSLDELFEQKGYEMPDEQTDLTAELQEAEEKLSRQALFLQAQKMIAQLPTKYQEVLVLRFGQNKKIAEIAIILNKREGTVKSLISRGLGLLRRHFSKTKMQPNMLKSIVPHEGRE